jgi:hypothetical protein
MESVMVPVGLEPEPLELPPLEQRLGQQLEEPLEVQQEDKLVEQLEEPLEEPQVGPPEQRAEAALAEKDSCPTRAVESRSMLSTYWKQMKLVLLESLIHTIQKDPDQIVQHSKTFRPC